MGTLRQFVETKLQQRKVERARRRQLRTLERLLDKARNTSFGKHFGFEELLNRENVAQAFQQAVPIASYTEMYPWWQRAFEGEKNVTWKGKTEFFALSSGTSEGASKFVPVTKDQLKMMRRGGLRFMLAIARNRAVPRDAFTHHNLLIGGSTSLQYNGVNYSGDLSGIVQLKLPFWYSAIRRPGPEIMKLDWANKIEEMVNDAPNWNVSMITGIPAWVQIILEKIIARYNLKTIHDIWPNFCVYVHSGVAIEPYKESLLKLLGKPVQFYNSYLSSEGFIAFNKKPDSKGMRISFQSGIFYEFVPFDDEHFTADGNLKPDAKALAIHEVEAGKDYALLISTHAGAWRYMIGDVVQFVSVPDFEIKITGRTKHFLSITGEHLSVDNMTQAVAECAHELNFTCNEFAAAAFPHANLFAHEWFIGCDEKVDEAAFKKLLDEKLCALNDDYKVERAHAIKEVFVHFLPNDVFNDFLKTRGKQGGQIKFPRVLKGEMYEAWKKFLQAPSA